MSRRLALSLALACAGPAALAAPAEPVRVLVIAALGDTIEVVQHVPETGSRLDRNQRQRVTLQGAGFDALAAQTAAHALRRLADITVADMVAFTPAPDAPPLISDGRFNPDEALRRHVAEAGAGQVLLLTRWRTAARLKLADHSVGSGALEGLGFYMDHQIRVRRSDTGEVGQGMLAPYAYLQATLIDATSGQVLRSEQHQGSETRSAARSPNAFDPWTAMTPEQKIESLQRLLRQGVTRIVPMLWP